MGTISSGIGLVSGINIDELVKKLVDLESGVTKQLQSRIDTSTEIQSALNTLSLRIVSTNLAFSKLGKGQSFNERTTTTSSDALKVVAGKGAPIGTYQFTPRRLVTTNQLLSSGVSSPTAVLSTSPTTIKISQGGFVDETRRLNELNGGAGVRIGSIRIVDAAGGSSVIDLTSAVNAGDVIDAINSTSGANVTARLRGDRFELVDNSGGAGTLQVSEVAGGKTALDLGLTSLSRTGNTYSGSDVYSLGTGLALSVLRDGNGIRTTGAGALTINGVAIDVSTAKTVGDVVTAINGSASGATASIVNDRLDLTGLTGTVTGTTAKDLGIELTVAGPASLSGFDIIGSLGSVMLRSLNGGSATATPTAGIITINGTNVDLSSARSLDDVIAGINNAGITGVTASFNQAANGISLRATGGVGLNVSNNTGNLATFLSIAGTAAGSDVTINSGDLNRQYINENTLLSSLGPTGIPKGKFRITDGNGLSAEVDLTQDADDTIGDVIREINTRGLAVSARINDTGDGILIERLSGTQALSVVDINGGTTAKQLNLTGAPNGSGQIDGTRETTISLAANATLQDLVTKLGEAGAPVAASIINDGSPTNGTRLSLTANKTGSEGRILVDVGSLGLNFSTVSRAQDAVLLLGSGSGVSPVQLVSTKNSFTGLIPGVEITAAKVSNEPVSLTIGEDRDSVVEAAQAFVDAYNEIRSYIKENASYDVDTNEKGLLFTDQTVRQVERQLGSFVSTIFAGTGSSLRSLGEVGIKLDGEGTLSLDEDKFRSAMASNASEVEKFFSATDVGVVAKFQKLTETLTSVAGGALTQRVDDITIQIDRQNTTLVTKQKLLKARETILRNQFYAMETALASFQSQQSALSQLTTIAAGFKSSR